MLDVLGKILGILLILVVVVGVLGVLALAVGIGAPLGWLWVKILATWKAMWG